MSRFPLRLTVVLVFTASAALTRPALAQYRSDVMPGYEILNSEIDTGNPWLDRQLQDIQRQVRETFEEETRILREQSARIIEAVADIYDMDLGDLPDAAQALVDDIREYTGAVPNQRINSGPIAPSAVESAVPNRPTGYRVPNQSQIHEQLSAVNDPLQELANLTPATPNSVSEGYLTFNESASRDSNLSEPQPEMELFYDENALGNDSTIQEDREPGGPSQDEFRRQQDELMRRFLDIVAEQQEEREELDEDRTLSQTQNTDSGGRLTLNETASPASNIQAMRETRIDHGSHTTLQGGSSRTYSERRRPQRESQQRRNRSSNIQDLISAQQQILTQYRNQYPSSSGGRQNRMYHNNGTTRPTGSTGGPSLAIPSVRVPQSPPAYNSPMTVTRQQSTPQASSGHRFTFDESGSSSDPVYRSRSSSSLQTPSVTQRSPGQQTSTAQSSAGSSSLSRPTVSQRQSGQQSRTASASFD